MNDPGDEDPGSPPRPPLGSWLSYAMGPMADALASMYGGRIYMKSPTWFLDHETGLWHFGPERRYREDQIMRIGACGRPAELSEDSREPRSSSICSRCETAANILGPWLSC